QLLAADGHGRVDGTGRDCVARVAERLRPGGAHVLQPGDGLVVELQRPREREPRDARAHGAEPVGVDVVLGDAGRVEGGCGRVDQQVLGALVPVLAELRAAHADDGDSIADALRSHLLASLAHWTRLPKVVVDAIYRADPA